MIKEYSRVLTIETASYEKVAKDEFQQWVLRVLGNFDVTPDQVIAAMAFEANMREWSEFLAMRDLEIIYNQINLTVQISSVSNKKLIGLWQEPQIVRMKKSTPGQRVVLLNYSEPI